MIRREDAQIAGVINLNSIIRGTFQNAFLGYYAFSPYEKKGLMQEGPVLVIRHAFSRLRLHRVEANIQPGNRKSLILVQRCGFVREGFSRHYLKVRGRWRDHERWAVLQDRSKPKS